MFTFLPTNLISINANLNILLPKIVMYKLLHFFSFTKEDEVKSKLIVAWIMFVFCGGDHLLVGGLRV